MAQSARGDRASGAGGRGEPPVDRSIRLRLRVYVAIFLVMAVVVVVDVLVIGPRSILPTVACLVGGAVLGMVASRMFALSWDLESEKVVGRLDVVGVVILVGYLVFTVFRGRLLGLWFDGPVLGVASLAAVAGLMAGQVVGTGRGVRRVLGLAAR